MTGQASDAENRRRAAVNDCLEAIVRAAVDVVNDSSVPDRPSVIALAAAMEDAQNGD